VDFEEPPQGEVRRTPLSRTPEDNERLGSNIQTLTTPELMFRALLTGDGTELIELAKPSIGHPNVCTLTHVHAAVLRIVGDLMETMGLTKGTG
jgi:hypothetical protein